MVFRSLYFDSLKHYLRDAGFEPAPVRNRIDLKPIALDHSANLS